MVLLQEVTIEGVDVSDYVTKWKTEDELFEAITIAELELTQDVVSLVTIDVGSTITIKRGFTTSTDEFVFDGFVEELEKSSGKTFKIFCQDKLRDLVKQSITKSFDKDIDSEAGVISEIFSTLVNEYGGGTLVADGTSIQDSSALPVLSKFVCDGHDVFERCQFLADLLDWQFYYKASDGKVYFEPKGFLGAYGTLTVGTEIANNVNWSFDGTQLANNIIVKGAKQEVETTESGQIGVTSGYSQTSILLTNTPVSTKVFCDAANPPTTLRLGGIDESTETFDYSVDKQNKKILWNTTQYTPGAADFVETRYSYNIPAPITGKNSVSIAKYKEVKKEFRFDDLKTIDDAQNKFNKLMDKYSVPFISCDEVRLTDLIDLKSGQTVTVVDVSNAENRSVLMQKIIKTWPYKGDVISVGDKLWKTAEWQVDIIDKIKEIDLQLAGDTNLLNHVIPFYRDFKPRRRYIELQKDTITDNTILIWDHPTQGEWDNFNWGGTAFGGATTTEAIVQGNMTYEEYAYDTDFHDAVNSTATFSTVTNDISFTAGQIWYSDAIDIGTTLSHITVTLGTVVGTLQIEISSDGKVSWQTVTEGTRTAISSSDGTGTYIRITETAAGVATIDLTQDDYGQNSYPVIRAVMEES